MSEPAAVVPNQPVLMAPVVNEHKKQVILWRLAQVVYLLALSALSSFLALNFFRQGWFIGVVIDVIGSFSAGTLIYEYTQKKIQRHKKWAEIAVEFKEPDVSNTLPKRIAEAQHAYYQKKFEHYSKQREDRIRSGKAQTNVSHLKEADEMEQLAAFSKICQAFFLTIQTAPSEGNLRTYCFCRFQNYTIRSEQNQIAVHLQEYNYFVEFFKTQRRLTTQQVIDMPVQDLSNLLFNRQS